MDRKEPSLKRGSYLVFADHKFAAEASGELRRLFGDAYSGGKVEDQSPFFVAAIRGGSARVLSRVRAKRPVFVDAVIPVYAVLESMGNEYENVTDAVAKLVRRRETFRIEAKRLGSGLQDRARSIEVTVGRSLEKLGLKADLKKPDQAIYVILLKDEVVIGKVAPKQVDNHVLDRFRPVQWEVAGNINRAEFKLQEAAEFFRIDLSRIRLALDVGAAPGGWTHYLLEQGIKVVAVDNALLDYENMDSRYRTLVLADKNELSELKKAARTVKNIDIEDVKKKSMAMEGYDLIHIKSHLKGGSAGILGRMGGFDLLTIDTNTAAADSAEIAITLSEFLNKSAQLLMTIKLFSRNVRRHVSAAKQALGGHYKVVGMKKLPHNRNELTLYARKIGGLSRSRGLAV